MIIGPGRWGTRMPSLGITVSFSEINTVNVVCEIAAMHNGFVPDLSMGTHFFNDMVEMDMLYMAFITTKEDNILNEDFLLQSPNHLVSIIPEASSWADTVKVIDGQDLTTDKKIYLNADSMNQTSVLYLAR